MVKRTATISSLRKLGAPRAPECFAGLQTLRSLVAPFLVLLSIAVISSSVAAAGTLEITEFMAINEQTLIDDDDDRSDWIEIHNDTKSTVDLRDWYLTDTPDELTKWRFPSMKFFPNAYMVVFASGKDRAALGAPLHTNFRLNADGEYLALVGPGETIVSEFAPTYPKQKPDVSYGLGRLGVTELILVPLGAPARAFIPANDELGLTWTEVGFDDSSWLSGTTGVGYDYPGLIGLDVAAMMYVNESVYIRIPFEITSLPEIDSLILRLQYEDGMAAYLNGNPIVQENAPDTLTWNSRALENRLDSDALSFIDIDISSARDLLRIGQNVLAFHGLNDRLNSSDLLLRPQLVATLPPEAPEVPGFFQSPTPGAPNGPAFPGVAGAVRVSKPSCTFVSPFSVELTLPDEASASAEIRYTLDGRVPNESSLLYTAPIIITTTTQLRARIFEPGSAVGPVVSETYIALSSDVVKFTSNLPLLVLDNFGRGWIPESSFQPAFMAIFEQPNGRSSLVIQPSIATRAGIEIRGSSTQGQAKPSLKVEAWNEADDDKNIAPLGMPPESDWVLLSFYYFDRALMRDPLIYELSNQIGRYAVRTRFVELFLNTNGGALSQADYFGVYALMEKITRDEDRVAVEKLFPEHDREPGVTGGYILKIDRLDPGDSGFYAAGQGLCYVYPKEVDIERPERDPQERYIQNFFNQLGAALNSPNYKDPQLGYAKYVDVDSWIDHHLLNVLACNVDAFRLSGYMFKKRGRKLEMGPLWDFDRSMGSTDGRDANPKVWRGGGDGTDFFNYPWWARMFTDIDFFQRYIDRWQELRKAQFSVPNIHSVIDSMADELREAQVRDLQRWGQTPRFGGYQGEVDHLKQWLKDRAEWMDTQFVSPPMFSSYSGQITPDFTLTTTAPAGSVYYTLDGSDPRLPGGRVSPFAQLYTVPITLTDTADIVARANNPDHVSLTGPSNPPLSSQWSGATRAHFSIHTPARAGNLVVTEINYHPLDPSPGELMVNPGFVKDDFEFIELKNIGPTTIDLTGVRFTNGVAFSFTGSEVTTLRPGECVLVVRNRAAFAARYGSLANVAGEYSGQFDNAGENLRLEDATGQVILDFDYSDQWCPVTDGFGFSLVIVNENAALGTWGSETAWRSSTNMGGSPGDDDPPPLGIPAVVVNEVLTHTDPPTKDAIELYNPTDAPVTISGWFLTDDAGNPKKFRIPDDTIIPEGGYLVYHEDAFNPTNPLSPTGFSLSSKGEEVYLFSADEVGNLTGYFHGFAFGAAEKDVTFGRYLTSTGREHFVAQIWPSLHEANAGPRVGPVVINEIMYNPLGGSSREEYIELRNLSSQAVPLFDPNFPNNTWRIESGLAYLFPTGVTLPPDGYLLVVSFDPVANTKALGTFRFRYGLDDSIRILGPYIGTLENSGGLIALFKPDAPRMPPDPDPGFVPYVLVDQVDYSNSAPWPPEPDGSGHSLQRLVGSEYGNDLVNWHAAAPTPGRQNSGADTDGDGLPDDWESANGLDPFIATGDDGSSGDPDGDGLTNLQEYLSGTHPRDSASFLKVDSIGFNTGSVVLRFAAAAGKTYSLLYRDAIENGDWVKLADVPAQSNACVLEIADPDAATSRTRFYRLVTPKLP